MTRNDVLKLFPDATDEQITNLLNKSGEEMAREKEKANQYKAKADKADELQTQLDELQNGNMTELEKANKALETANQQIAKLQKDNAVRDLREKAMSDFGITAEQVKTVVKEDGSFDTTSLGKIISDMKANAIAEYEKNALKDTPNPNNGGNNNDGDTGNKTNAEKIAESLISDAPKSNNMYDLVNKMFIICMRKGLKLVMENPYSEEHFLRRYWCYPPAVIDRDRRDSGDYFKKPTQYWFLNCEPQNNLVFEPISYNTIECKDVIRTMSKEHYVKTGADNKKTARSMIHPQYADRFIRQYILDEEIWRGKQ